MPPTPGLSLLAAAAVSAVLHLAAERRGSKRLTWLFKPLTTSILIGAAALMPDADPRYRLLILVGLLFSLAGDVFLMLPGDRFKAGLASFLAAHIAYIAAFGSGTPMRFALLLPYAAIAVVVLRMLWPGLGGLRLPVTVYVVALVAMAWAASSRAASLDRFAAYAAQVGATLFLASDAALAIRRFRGPFPGAQIAIMTTYVAAQALIAYSVSGTAP